jgi:hypothetical protein
MEVNDRTNEIRNAIKELENEFEKLIISNPYLLKLTNKKTNNDIQKTYKKFKIYDTLRYIFFIILGFVFCLMALGSCYIYFSYKETSAIQENYSLVYYIVKAMPIILLVLALFVTVWVTLIQKILTKEETIPSIAIAFILWIFTVFSFAKEDNNILFLVISPLIGYFIVILSLCFIYQPLSSRTLREAIIDKTKLIQDKLDALNKYSVENSHSKIEKEIEDLKLIIINNSPYPNCNDLLKKQALNLLDLIKLELIINSRNGINLFENWNFIDSSKKMIDEIKDKSNTNKHITIVGDLSFLCTEKGVTMLIDSIIKGKTYDIYFTGAPKGGNAAVLTSGNCEKLVNKISEKVSNSEDKTTIRSNLKLLPIKAEYFTGIGFIGLGNKDDNTGVKHEKIYSYISSFITNETKDIDISNPLVFSWDKKTNLFDSFVSNLQCDDLKVTVNGQDVPYGEILNVTLK